MKKQVLILMVAVAFASCSDSSSDEFDNANGNVAQKYLSKLQVIPSDASEETSIVNFYYNSDNTLNRISDGYENAQFAYQNNKLNNVTGDGEPYAISELYQAPFKGYEVGKVLNYDSKGNPTEIRLFQDGVQTSEDFIAQITYDNAPNTLFYTMKAAGIIDVLDNTEISMNFSAPREIIKAKLLLPVNNVVKVVIKNSRGVITDESVSAYVYDADNYPTSSTITTTSENEISVEKVYYQYR